jgi:hypothetical protein
MLVQATCNTEYTAMQMTTGTAAQVWQSELQQAQQRLHVRLSESQESYLVFTLIRHARDATLSGRIMAIELFDALGEPGRCGSDRLRDVGDRCLLIAGLFPGLRARRRVDAGYYQEVGRTAYGLLGERAGSALATLYAELARSYGDLVRVLLGLRVGSVDGRGCTKEARVAVPLREVVVAGNA